MSVSAENKAIAKHALKAFGGTPNVQAYHHDLEVLSVDILRCENQPVEGISSYSTIGLSDYPMLTESGAEFPTRLEIAGACATADQLFANILASAAFGIIRSQKLYGPGSVLPGYVHEYYPESSVPHLYFTAPFLWEDSLKTLDCATKKASWLLAIPISDREWRYLQSNGDKAFEELLEKANIDIFDLYRAPAA